MRHLLHLCTNSYCGTRVLSEDVRSSAGPTDKKHATTDREVHVQVQLFELRKAHRLRDRDYMETNSEPELALDILSHLVFPSL